MASDSKTSGSSLEERVGYFLALLDLLALSLGSCLSEECITMNGGD